MTREQILQAVTTYGGWVKLFNDIDAGLITLTLQDFRNLPSTFVEARRTYKTTLDKIDEKK